jgi:integrase/recombinase XerD
VLDVCGRRRSPATFPDFAAGRPPRNKGREYPKYAPTVAEIVQFLRAIPETPHGRRFRALVIVGWRSGLRVAELCALEERDLNRRDFAVVVRHGKGDKRRISGMDEWGWEQLAPWLDERREYPVGALFPVLNGPTAGRPLATTIVRSAFRRTTVAAGLRVRLHAHSLRHAHAVEPWREKVDLYTISRQLGHANIAITAHYLASLAPFEILEPIGRRHAPVMAIHDLSLAA